MYKIRKSWANAASQLGAFEVLANAKNLVDKNAGYSVYKDTGARLYPYLVTVPALIKTLGVRKVRLDGNETTVWKQSALTSTYAAQLGVTATAYTVTAANLAAMKTKVKTALQSGKQVICFTHKYDSKDPFASGDHYVLAVGYNKADKIVVANSGGPGRIQYVSLTMLMKYLYHSGTGKDATWLKSSAGSAGIVIVG